jgi:DNA-binding SARP family transcriptional activator
MASLRIESDVNLFYSEKTDEFFCTVQEFADRNRSTIRVYSLASDPVPAGVYLASLQQPKKPGTAGLLLLLLPLTLLAMGLAWFLVRKRNGPRKPLAATSQAAANPVTANNPATAANPVTANRSATAANPVAANNPATAEPEPAPEPLTTATLLAPKNRNAVYLLGEFAVFDRQCNDITHLFSPKIKQLFVLILLNSQDGKGISSRKISARLWPEKDLAKTKNIKGVTFNHLRSIIGDIDGIELVFLNDSYSFKLDGNFFCDYCLLAASAPAAIMDHFHLITRGPLLPDMPESLIDESRSAFETRLIDLLLPQLQKHYDAHQFKLTLEIAKSIIERDAFNEEALTYQLRSFRRLRGIDYSRKAYDQFTQDYERSLGIAYHTSFDEIVH